MNDQYRKFEQHILDKQATWNCIQGMPTPSSRAIILYYSKNK